MILSLIVPVYNAEAHLPGLLAQLRAQARPGVEAVFVDDGSTDASAALIERAAASFPMPLRLLRQENAGASAARNAGLEAAQGEYIAFADADDVLAPDHLDRLAAEAERGGFDALFFDIARLAAGETSLPAAGPLVSRETDADALLDEFLRDPKLFGPYSMLLRRAFLSEGRLRFAEGYAYYEDYDLLIRVMLSAARPRHAGAVLYGYRMAEGSAMQRFSAERFLCLDLARADAEAVASARLAVSPRFAKWFEARLFWSVLWQAALALRSLGDSRRFLRATGGAELLRRLADYPDRKVALTALLARLFPEGFALLARLLGGGRSRIRRLSPQESAAVITACRVRSAPLSI